MNATKGLLSASCLQKFAIGVLYEQRKGWVTDERD